MKDWWHPCDSRFGSLICEGISGGMGKQKKCFGRSLIVFHFFLLLLRTRVQPNGFIRPTRLVVRWRVTLLIEDFSFCDDGMVAG